MPARQLELPPPTDRRLKQVGLQRPIPAGMQFMFPEFPQNLSSPAEWRVATAYAREGKGTQVIKQARFIRNEFRTIARTIR